MRCAEQQLMPVPVINRALKLDTSMARENPATFDAKHGHEVDQEKNDAELIGAEGKGYRCRWGCRVGETVARPPFLLFYDGVL